MYGEELIQRVVSLEPHPAARMHTLANQDDVAYHAVRSLWVAAVWIQLLLSPPVSERNSSSALRDWNTLANQDGEPVSRGSPAGFLLVWR